MEMESGGDEDGNGENGVEGFGGEKDGNEMMRQMEGREILNKFILINIF